MPPSAWRRKDALQDSRLTILAATGWLGARIGFISIAIRRLQPFEYRSKTTTKCALACIINSLNREPHARRPETWSVQGAMVIYIRMTINM